MKAYLTRKLVALPLILLGVSFLIFGAVRMLPGDPARIMAGPQATQDAVDGMRTRLGLDQPFLVQYGLFLSQASVTRAGGTVKLYNHEDGGTLTELRLPRSYGVV